MIDANGPGVRKWILALALLAFVRIAFGVLSFPYFGHMDEIAHVDLVYRWANGTPPSATDDTYVADTVEMFVFYSSDEWVRDPAQGPTQPLPAERDWPEGARAGHLAQMLTAFEGKANHEALEAPPYYAAAGAVLAFGRTIGLDPLDQLTLIRLVGAFMVAGGVWFAFLFVRRLTPERPFLWLGIPVLVAVFPQDVFYFINNDVPSILVFPAALWLAVRLRDEAGGIGERVLFGFLVGLMFITKAPNMTLLFASLAILTRPWKISRDRLAAAIGFALPVLPWHVYLFLTSGHLTPSFHKCEVLGITPKESLAAWFDHPIYTFEGFSWFFGRLMDHFWRGEIEWHGEIMRNVAIDTVLAYGTVLFCAVSLVASALRRSNRLPDSFVIGACISILVGFAIMVAISVAFDFGPNMYPSREFPYLVTGRVHNGMIVILGLLLLDGLERCTRWLGPKAPWIALGILAVTLFVYETVLMLPVAASPHNFWHLDV